VSGYLLLADGSHRVVRDGFVIGRVAGCDLVIDDTKASRRHARLIVDAGVVEVEDLESSNGTLLNDKPVTRRVLRDGDRVRIGKTELLYCEGEPPGGQRPAPSPAPRPAATSAAPPPPAAPVEPPRSVTLDDDDDDDLLGAAMLASAPPTPPKAVEPPARPPIVIKEHPARRPEPAPPATEVSKPPPPKPPPAVVEFADEVVEVRRPAPAAANKPKGPAPAAAAPAAGRILQYSKQAGGSGGVLGDDLAQIGGGTRWLLYVGVLAVAVGLVWVTMRLVG
jgi:predicted component of type VI protein secretion system